MKTARLALTAAGLLLLVQVPARAQVPFFNGGGAIFDPEISVVSSGVVLDAQAVVSADRKYVTLTSRYQQAQLLALREFAFQTGGGGQGGQVGGGGVAGAAAQANLTANGRATAGAGAATGVASGASPTNHSEVGKPYPVPGKAVTKGKSVLEQEGMTLVGRVTPAPAE
jgi:hypothetical protein